MVNPLSGHTTTSLADGQSLTSASITNLYEGVHGNGIIRIDDGAYGDSNRKAIGSGTAGLVTVSGSGAVTVHGGYAVLGGVMYSFAGGPGATTSYTAGNATWHLGSLPSVPGTTSDVVVTIYVLANSGTGIVNIKHHFGTAIVPTTGTPLASTTALSLPGPTNNQEITILATLKYTMTGGAANVTASLNTPAVSDKRCFIRPSPLYLTPITKGAAGNFATNNAVDQTNQSSLDSMGIFTSAEEGAFTASPFGAIWQSHSPDGHAVLYYSARRDQGGSSARNTWRLAPNEVKTITTGTSQLVDFDGPNIWVITTTDHITLTPRTNGFPHSHTIRVYHPSGSHTLRFDPLGLNYDVAAGKSVTFGYNGSAWSVIGLSGAGTGTVTSVAVTGSDGIQVDSGSPITASGTIALGVDASALSTHLSLGTAATTAATAYATAAQGAKADSAQQPPSEGAFANGDKTKLDGIDVSADVTDATTVTAAGALMDSEVTNLAQVKAFDETDYATAAQGGKADTAQQPPSEGAFVNGDKTKLDAIDASADVTDATTVNAAGAIMHSDLGTKGDLVVGDGAGDATILGVGTNNHVLTADSSEASGVKWAASAGGITALTGDVTASGSGSVAATIAADAVTYAKIQNVAADNVLLGNDNGAGSPVQELDAGAVRTMLNVADGADAALPVANGNTVAIAAINAKASKCFVYLSGNQTVSAGPNKVTHDTALWNDGSNYDTTNKYYVAPRDGYYLVACSFYFTSSPSWAMSLIYVDENAGAGFAIRLRRHSANGQDTHLSAVIKLNANDKVAHYAQTSTNGTIGAGLNTLTYFQVTEML